MKVLRHFAMKAIFSMSFFNFPPGGKEEAIRRAEQAVEAAPDSHFNLAGVVV